MSSTTVSAMETAGRQMGSASAGMFRDVETRRYATQLGVWCFLGTVTMLFAAFSSSYIVRQSGTDWQATPLPTILWMNTLMLVASSVSLEIARHESRRGNLAISRSSLATTVLLGIAFLIGQFGAWLDLAAAGYYVPTNPHSSFFYILTGLHAVHLMAGLIILAYLIGRVSLSERRGDADAMPFVLSIGATFWHFFGALWIYLFAMLSLV